MLSFGLTYYLCLLLELLYPTYASLRAIQTSDKFDDTQWLTYWVVYAITSTIEAVGAYAIAWIPLYWEIKCAFVLWLIAPQIQGARKLYEDVIMPLLKKYAKHIDPVFERVDSVLQSQMVGQLAKYIDKHGPSMAEEALKRAQEQGTKFAAAAQAAASEHMKQQQQQAGRKDL
ncbi:hypothetical protein HYH03_002287 [Edaphochlamys debaryana]|uniref:HVA22-like protein n=1 Tax=Edaphochlamys debaryana TaxID=47281 RepID=A0A836C4M4_9CHLO|nr:hypothetical protein HYH03_002287 [Edaphochlamys debaryana]|eukprot:KAG2500005.1 hypothetical protein HYH03_002287 [Edaphochlamys debaryana]